MKVYNGSCLCGEIEYEITGEIGEVGHCHCQVCQKAHSAAFATYINVKSVDFRFIKGKESLGVFRSSDTVSRTCCKDCGSTLQFIRDGKPGFGVSAGTFDTEINSLPSYEIWTSACPSWGQRDGILQSHATQPRNEEVT